MTPLHSAGVTTQAVDNVGWSMLDALPTCVVKDVTKHLSLSEVVRLLGVNQELGAVADEVLELRDVLTSDDIRKLPCERQAGLLRWLPKHCPRLAALLLRYHHDITIAPEQLHHTTFAASLVTLLTSSSALRRVDLVNCPLDGAMLQALANSPVAAQLQHLQLGYSHSYAACTAALQQHQAGDPAPGQALPAALAQLLQACSALESLQLGYLPLSSAVLDAVGAAAGRAQRLRHLALHACTGVSRHALVRLFERCQWLQRLALMPAGSQQEPSCLAFEVLFALAAHCGDLRQLKLSEELLPVAGLDDSCLAPVAAGCPLLQHLELVQLEVGDALLGLLAQHCRGLQVLRLEQTYASDAGVAAVVEACPELRDLHVSGCSLHCWLLPHEMALPGASFGTVASVSSHCDSLTALHLSGLSHKPQLQHSAGAAGPDLTDADAEIAAAAAAIAASWCGASAAAPSSSASSSAAAQPLPALAPQLCLQLLQLSLDWLRAPAELLEPWLLSALLHCQQLRSLSLVGYRGKLAALLPALATAGARVCDLDLSHTAADGELLEQLPASFPALQRLGLSYCPMVSERGATRMAAGLPALRRLELYRCGRVAAAGLAAMLVAALGAAAAGSDATTTTSHEACSSDVGAAGGYVGTAVQDSCLEVLVVSPDMLQSRVGSEAAGEAVCALCAVSGVLLCQQDPCHSYWGSL